MKEIDREFNVVKRARFNQTIESYQTNEVPESKFGVEPHTVKELPALPVRERQQDNMLLHQQLQDNMLDEEVVSFGQRAQHQQDQQQLQLRQNNIPHNPVYPKQSRVFNLASPNLFGETRAVFCMESIEVIQETLKTGASDTPCTYAARR